MDAGIQSHGEREPGAAAVAVDASGNVFTTGFAHHPSGHKQFYTAKYDALDGHLVWNVTYNAGAEAFPNSIACDSEGNVIVTGRATISGNINFYTAKYNGTTGALIWSKTYDGTAGGLDEGIKVAVDSNNDVIVTGWLEDSGGNQRAYTIKHDTVNGGTKLGDFIDLGFVNQQSGQPFGESRGRQLIIDGANNVVLVGETDNADLDSDIFITKYDSTLGSRIFFDSFAGSFGSDDTSVPANAVYSTGNAPAISDNGVAARITMASGKTKLGAIFTQTAAGGTTLPAVQKGDAPGITGAKFASFSDPIIAPNGQYAFAAKVTGAPAAQASGVWTNLGGTLHLALVKVAAPATSNVALVAIDAANNGTVVRRTSQAVTLNGKQSTISKLTVLTPPKTSPGNGRWHGGAATVVKATNNLGVWDRDSSGVVRRLLRTGDVLGTQTVKSFTPLKAVSTAPAAARSFSDGGSIAALVKIGIP